MSNLLLGNGQSLNSKMSYLLLISSLFQEIRQTIKCLYKL